MIGIKMFCRIYGVAKFRLAEMRWRICHALHEALIKAIVKELVKQEVDIDEIYYKRQDLENYFTQLVDSERR